MDEQITFKESKIIDVKFEKNITIIKPCNIYGCSIEDNVFIGPFVEIQKNLLIKKNTKTQSHSFICELVEIGENCFISHGVFFINDLFKSGGPSGGDQKKWKKTKIDNHVSIGSNSTILPVKICNSVVVGAGSVVIKDICNKGFYAGKLAKLIREIY